MSQNKEIEDLIQKSVKSLSYFIENVFPLSFVNQKYIRPSHLTRYWAPLFQNYQNTCLLASRKHLKSTIVYAYLMWKLLRTIDYDYELLYLSYKADLGQYHVKNFKKLVDYNPLFAEVQSLTPAETIARYSWDNKHEFIIEPEGVLSFKRGRHPNEVICDDVLADPATQLDPAIIKKINRIFQEDIFSLPKEGGNLRVVGTAQTPQDFFYSLKGQPNWGWGKFPAELDPIKKQTLWPEMFSWQNLQEKRKVMGDKAYDKEFLIKPVYAAESFFQREQFVPPLVNPDLKNVLELNTHNTVVGGFDVGKKTHPSHFAVFELVGNRAIQRYQRFFDRIDYYDQVQEINELVKMLKIDKVYYDSTRGELEGFVEQGIMPKSVYVPVPFSLKNKNTMATEFSKVVSNNEIELINDRRQIEQILLVTNDLQAIETDEGHGDSFWSIALAIYGIRQTPQVWYGGRSAKITG